MLVSTVSSHLDSSTASGLSQKNALEFLYLLQGGAPEGAFLEIRFQSNAGGGMQSHFLKWPAATLPNLDGHVYFGVALRRERSGKKAACLPTDLRWVDIDLGDILDCDKDELLQLPDEELQQLKADLLHDTKCKMDAAGLTPLAIVDSGYGLHLYFRSTAAETGMLEDHNRRLVHLLGGDKVAVDHARILRLPGSFNWKNSARPRRVQLLHSDATAFVTGEALSALPLPAPVQAAPPPSFSMRAFRPKNDNRQQKYAQAALEEECAAVARTASGGRNARLNAAAFSLGTLVGAGALDESEATAGLMYAATACGLPDFEARATVRSGMVAGMRQPRALDDLPDKAPPSVTFVSIQSKVNTSAITVQDGAYHKSVATRFGHSSEALTNFTFEPLLKLQKPDGTHHLRGSLKIAHGQSVTVDIDAATWNSRSDVVKAFGGYGGLFFSNSNADAAHIGAYLAPLCAKLPVAEGVTSYGLHTLKDGRLHLYADSPADELWYCGTEVERGSDWFNAPLTASREKVDLAREALALLPTLTTPSTAWALMAYAASSAHAPRLTPLFGSRLPFLYVAGEREAGKTSFAQLVLEMATGRQSRIHKAGRMTNYQYDRAFSNCNNLLAILDEYRPGCIDDAQLRKHHDLGSKWRGTGSGSDNSYHLNAPLMVLGEGFSEDAATLSRGVQYMVRKADRGSVEAYRAAVEAGIGNYSGHLHHLAATLSEQDLLARLRDADNLATAAANANPRLRFALSWLAFGLLSLRADGVAVNDETIRQTLADGAMQTTEGYSEGKTNLEIFLEQLCSVINAAGPAALGLVAIGHQETLILRSTMCVQAVKRHFGPEAAIANARLFTAYARESGFFLPGEVHKSATNDLVRGMRLSLPDMPERCDADYLRSFWMSQGGRGEV